MVNDCLQRKDAVPFRNIRGRNDFILSFEGRDNSAFCGFEVKRGRGYNLHGSQAKCELFLYGAQSRYPFIQVHLLFFMMYDMIRIS